MFSTKTVTLFVVCIVACEACQGNMRNRGERQRYQSAETAIAEGDTAAASQLTGGGGGAGGGRSAPARSAAVARARAGAAARARSRTADGQTRAAPTPAPRG